MNISVVIPTYNNSATLNKTLNSFLRLAVSPDNSWELVIVNNNSSDETKKTIESYLEKLPIIYIFEPQQGVSNAKNAGLKKAQGELIIFADDDIKPCRDWLEIYWQEYTRSANDLYWGGPIVSDFEVIPIDMKLIALGPASVKGLNWGGRKKVLQRGEFFVGANWAAPAAALRVAGGYNSSLGLNPLSGKVLVGEENDLMERLHVNGLRPQYLPDACVEHFVPKSKMTIKHIADRSEASGRFDATLVLEPATYCIFGVPRWVWKKTLILWIKYIIKKIKGGEFYADYVEYRRLLGCIKEIRGL